MACSNSSGSSPEIAVMRRLVAAIVACLTLAACGHEPLYADLDEQQANEMLAVLVRAGMDAAKVRAEKGWSIEIGRKDLPRAVQILKAEGYPREHFDSLGQVFHKEGFVSTPLEERARLLYALSQELSRTVSSIDGVIVARVHLAIPERRPLSDEKPLSSASVFIKYKPGSQVVNKTASIKALIVNSVEGLPYENVTVTFFASETPDPAAPWSHS
jgi:type III secretion protein J